MARRRRHTEEQILSASRQAEGGTTVMDVCRHVGISQRVADGRWVLILMVVDQFIRECLLADQS